METVTDHPAPEPLFIGVEEAAHLLGISRSFAYDMAHLSLATDGAEGLPAIRLGRRLLIRRSALDRLAGRFDGGDVPVSP